MGGRAEPIKTESLALTRKTVAAPADQPCAKPRRDLGIVTFFTQRETKACVCDRMRREAAIPRVPGECGTVAQVFMPAATIGTNSTRRPNPRHANALTNRKSTDTLPQCRHSTYNLVPRNNRHLRVRKLPVNDVQIGAANPACRDDNQNFACPRRR